MSDQEKPGNDESVNSPKGSMADCCGQLMDRIMGAGRRETGSSWWSGCEEMMKKMTERENPMDSCPMSANFGRFSGMRGAGLLAVISGLMLVLVGVAIILEPQILIWLLAALSIGAGLMLLAAVAFFRRASPRFGR